MQMKGKHKAQEIAENCMRWIAPLLTPGLDCAQMKKLKEEISQEAGASVSIQEKMQEQQNLDAPVPLKLLF